MPHESPSFCELLKRAIEHAPNDDARDALQYAYDLHCEGISTNDTGDNGPPPKQ